MIRPRQIPDVVAQAEARSIAYGFERSCERAVGELLVSPGMLVVDDMDISRYAQEDDRTSVSRVRDARLDSEGLVVAELSFASGHAGGRGA